LEEGRRILAGLPLVAAGLITFEIIPLAPYDGHARLFEKDFNPVSDLGEAPDG
jgi:hypothetical protein